jgi:DNA-directed RNA polymerase subunit RPC12/RpoP
MERQICSDCNLLMQLGYESLGLVGSNAVIWCPKCGHRIYGELHPEMLILDVQVFPDKLGWLRC